MTDFVPYEPDVHALSTAASVNIRPAKPADAIGLAAVMAVRGGAVGEHVDRASTLIMRLDVLLIAEKGQDAVGWCGVQKFAIEPDGAPEWLVAGLTVVPDMRRQGIAACLLRGVLGAMAEVAPGESIFSVINARNRASIDLHLHEGFVEVGRSASYAGITFTGGQGVLLRHG